MEPPEQPHLVVGGGHVAAAGGSELGVGEAHLEVGVAGTPWRRAAGAPGRGRRPPSTWSAAGLSLVASTTPPSSRRLRRWPGSRTRRTRGVPGAGQVAAGHRRLGVHRPRRVRLLEGQDHGQLQQAGPRADDVGPDPAGHRRSPDRLEGDAPARVGPGEAADGRLDATASGSGGDDPEDAAPAATDVGGDVEVAVRALHRAAQAAPVGMAVWSVEHLGAAPGERQDPQVLRPAGR